MPVCHTLSPAVQDFWNAFLAQSDDPQDAEARFFEAFQIGATEEDADEGAHLIDLGAKTATSTLLWEIEVDGSRMPSEGDLSIVLNGRNEPICVVETMWLAVQPFSLADEKFACEYGEWDCTLPTWRKECWAYYSEQCEALGRSPSEEMPLVCERFRVIFRAES